MSLISELTALKNKENTLRGNNAVTPFAYDSEAYNADDADGHADYVSNRHNNIPLADNAVIELNPFVTNKGLRKQASSFTRQLINHFCGRSSYNLNKTTDVVHGALDKLASYVGQPDGLAVLDANGRIPSAQLPEDAVEYKGSWNAQTNSPHLVNGTGDKGDMYFVSQAGEQNLWNKLIWNRQFDEFSFRDNIISMCYGNGAWLALDDDSNLHYSNDDFKTKLGGLLASNITDVCFHNGRFFYVRNASSFVMYFAEALTAGLDVWTAVRNVPIGSLHCIYGDSGALIAGGTEGIIKSIDNGESWSVVSSTSIKKIAGYNSTWVACKTDGGLIVSSDNGETWTDIESVSSDVAFISIFANNGKWIASTEGQGVWQSLDTETWTMLSFIPEKAVCLDVYAYGDIWVISSTGGIDETVSFKGMYISYDNAVTWSEEGAEGNKGITLARSRGDIWLCSSYTKGFDNAVIYKADYYSVTFLEGDEVVYNGSVWERIPVGTLNTVDGVSPVNGNVAVTGKNLKFEKDIISKLNQGMFEDTVTRSWLSYAGDMFFSGTSSASLWSEDGKNFSSVKLPEEASYFATVVQAFNLYIATGNTGLLWSEDGKNWYRGTGATNYNFAYALIANLCYANGIALACTSNNGAGIWWSEDGKNWNQVASTAGLSFSTLAYLNGVYLASGTNRGIWWSEDGKNWTQANTSTTSFRAYAFAYHNSLYLSACSNGLWQSSDGKTWTKQFSGTDCYGIWYLENYGIWLLNTSSKKLKWSNDGSTWTECTMPTTVNSRSSNLVLAEFNNKLYFASSYIYTSEDGKTWTRTSASAEFLCSNNNIMLAGKIIVSSGYSAIQWSTDGNTWQDVLANIKVDKTIFDVVCSNGNWLLSSDYTANNEQVGLFLTDNVELWNSITARSISTHNFKSLFMKNNFYVACATNNYGVYFSLDGGNTWQTTLNGKTINKIQQGGSRNNEFIACSTSNGLWLGGSATQFGWDFSRITGETTNYTFNSVFYYNGTWIACSESHGLWKSTNGTTWTQVTGITADYTFNSVFCYNGTWIACSESHGLWKSTNGTTWTQVTGITADYTFNSVFCYNGTWVACSEAHGLWKSSNGTTWTQVTGITADYTFNSIFCYEGTWVACSESHGVLYFTTYSLSNVTQAISYIKSKLGIQ